jgi:hypothetical protein
MPFSLHRNAYRSHPCLPARTRGLPASQCLRRQSERTSANKHLLFFRGFGHPRDRPGLQRFERRAKGRPNLCQPVFHSRWHLRINFALHDAVLLHVAQLLDKHLLRDTRDRSAQFRESQDRCSEEMKQDQYLPPTFDSFYRLFEFHRGACPWQGLLVHSVHSWSPKGKYCTF